MRQSNLLIWAKCLIFLHYLSVDVAQIYMIFVVLDAMRSRPNARAQKRNNAKHDSPTLLSSHVQIPCN